MTREEFIVKAQQLADDFGALLDEFLEDKKHLYASPNVSTEGNIIIAELTVSYINDDDDDKENLQKTITGVEVHGDLDNIRYKRFHNTGDVWEAWHV